MSGSKEGSGKAGGCPASSACGRLSGLCGVMETTTGPDPGALGSDPGSATDRSGRTYAFITKRLASETLYTLNIPIDLLLET